MKIIDYVIESTNKYIEKMSKETRKKMEVRKMPIKINGDNFTFSLGKHNQLQKLIIE